MIGQFLQLEEDRNRYLKITPNFLLNQNTANKVEYFEIYFRNGKEFVPFEDAELRRIRGVQR